MEKALHGFSLRINVLLLVAAIACAAVSDQVGDETLRITCIVVGWILALVALVPSIHGFALERMTRGKARLVEDPNTIVPEWRQFCQSMGVENDIHIKVFANLRNAQAKGTTIEIGQPVLDSLEGLSLKAVFAHELAHIRISSDRALRHVLCLVLAGAAFICVIRATVPWVFTYSIGQLGFSWFILSVVSISGLSLAGVATRFRSWPDEYEADLMADQCVKQDAIVSALTALATLRKMDVTRDFYSHPSVNKRKANLGWSRRKRFRQWYFAL